MQQNYYIYERDGKISILPWDYGLAFGGFQSGNASSVVNFPIDTPVSGVSMESRPLLNMLLAVDEYRDRYHEYLRMIVEGYFESGLLGQTINELDAKIGVYVKNDVSAYFTYEQYNASLPVMIELGNLRAESVKGQLDGTIPSTSSGQSADSSSLVDASGIDLSALGSMMGGGMGQMGQGGFQDRQGGVQDWQGRQPGSQGGLPDRQGGIPGEGLFDMELMQQAMLIVFESGGELTDEVKAELLELGLTEDQIEMFFSAQNEFPGNGMFGNVFPNDNERNALPGGNDNTGGADPPAGNNSPSINPPGGGATGNPPQTISDIDTGYAVTIILLLSILAGAIIFVAKPGRNRV